MFMILKFVLFVQTIIIYAPIILIVLTVIHFTLASGLKVMSYITKERKDNE